MYRKLVNLKTLDVSQLGMNVADVPQVVRWSLRHLNVFLLILNSALQLHNFPISQ